jgi:hypothetical protein
MNQRGINSRDEDAVVQAGGERGIDDLNSSNTSTTEDGCNDDINEQFRIMAQLEATFRVKDNTGFDMVEYKEQVRLLEEERQQQQSQERERGRYHTKPKPMLPDVQKLGMGNSGSETSSLSSKGPSRPEEPPLPFTRANRRYAQNGRSSSNNNNNRVRVPEICPGVVVPKHSPTATTAISATTSIEQHIVKCWGCSSSVSEIYLRVNILATLVQCPECLTISPVL